MDFCDDEQESEYEEDLQEDFQIKWKTRQRTRMKKSLDGKRNEPKDKTDKKSSPLVCILFNN